LQKLESGEWVIWDKKPAGRVLPSPIKSPDPKSGALTTDRIQLYQFPSPEEFSVASEEELRALGMGYRAK
jgi:hypothetical protein